ncbi:MAG TPA: FAD:protein FMN transferase [Pirellulaceae bacterium]|nr:FAD:protein FMN transferase [Pirellulaceae bacterium]HMO91957.1 FAD:protein FMN transferase [Pirellulaceae bacterium]HMP68756.1 FAD:protein FMN transferase [Pirellulaceae bacterium]
MLNKAPQFKQLSWLDLAGHWISTWSISIICLVGGTRTRALLLHALWHVIIVAFICQSHLLKASRLSAGSVSSIISPVASGTQDKKTGFTLSEDDDAVRVSGTTMGPIKFNVTIAKSEIQIGLLNSVKPLLAQQIEAELEIVNRLMSTYLADSDVSRFNRHETAEWFDVAPETAAVVENALSVSRLSQAAFDITVGPLVNLWNFGPTKKENRIPSEAEIAAILEYVGYEKLSVELEPPRLRKDVSDLQIDLSGIAKGYAVDRVANLLSQNGFYDFLVEVGGEVVARGKKRNGSFWVVGILQPNPFVTSVGHAVRLQEQAMATSGDYENFYQIDDQVFSHTIDPATGRPTNHALASVSIIADTCMEADALATAVLVMGPERGQAFCESNRIQYLMIVRNTNGELTHLKSPEFPIAQIQQANTFANVILPTIFVFVIVMALMAVGVMFGRRKIQGSCGGIASLKSGSISPECSMCSNPTQRCETLKKEIEKRRSSNAAES